MSCLKIEIQYEMTVCSEGERNDWTTFDFAL